MTDRRLEFQHRERVRLIYSLRDLQIASSAAAFLGECDPEEKYSKVELRRFRCYETAMVMAYTRPFSEARGKIRRLTFKMSDVKLSHDEQELHTKLIDIRNKTTAHSDEDMMRVVSQTHSIVIGEAFKFNLLQTVFDEGLEFIGLSLHGVSSLISTVYSAVHTKLLMEAQAHPECFDFRKDYLTK